MVAWNLHGNIGSIEDTQPSRVFVVIHVEVSLKTKYLRVADIRAIDERAQEE